MDLPDPRHPEASTSSSTAPDNNLAQHSSPAPATSEPKSLRSSARVKAAQEQKSKAKGKGRAKEREQAQSQEQSPSSSTQPPAESAVDRSIRTTAATSKSKRAREGTSGKGKGKEVIDEAQQPAKRPRRSANAPLTINEPSSNLKGKKRAAPEADSDNDNAQSSSSPKRTRTSYSLRPRDSPSNTTDMPRKTKSTTLKGKMAMKEKAMAAAASSSRLEDEDVEMMESEPKQLEADIHDEHPMDDQDGGDSGDGSEGEHDHGPEDHEPRNGDEDDEDGDNDDVGLPPAPGGLDDSAALAIFGDYRHFGSYMLSLSSRLKTILENIKPTADPTTRLLSLQELNELLSMSTEDTLAGSFRVEQFVAELVKILGGRGIDEDEDRDGNEDGEQDEDAALAAALQASGGAAFAGDENPEAQVLACRCLANLMEALPGVAHTIVYHGAIPVLCNKLTEISYIDLAEQTLSTMEKISEEFPSAIVREGGLAALLNYLDFFSIAVQRTALQAASNCCRNISPDYFTMLQGVWPIIRNCLTYSDQRLVEFACLCVIRIVDSYHRSSTTNLELLIDQDLIQTVNQLLHPSGSSLIAANTYTLLLRALATAARASPKVTLALLEADFVSTLYHILTGVLPSTESVGFATDGEESQGLGGGLADMTVMENLAHRPKDQVEEALSLVSELMPPLPKEGVFDHKSYTEKALNRLIKAKAKADRAAARQFAAQVLNPFATPSGAATPTEGTSDIVMADTPQDPEDQPEPTPTPVPPADRTELLRTKPDVVGRYMQLTVPILIDVYAASVNTPVRIKTLTGLLKAVGFLDGEGVKKVLTFVPVASFASSILSSKDHPSLVIGALQLVDLLLMKVPSLYKPVFRREGVFHEIESLAARTPTSSKSKEKTDKDGQESAGSSDSSVHALPPSVALATFPGFKKLSSMSLDPDDAITLRARVIKFKYLSSDEQEEDNATYENLRTLVDKLSKQDATEHQLAEVLWELASLFASPNTSVSSFELLQSGLVDGLLRFATNTEQAVPLSRRRDLLVDALVARKQKNIPSGQTPFATFVKKLQEALTRMESFDVVTIAQNSDDSKRSSPSLLARQLRLRLVADEESGVPRNLHNIVVSIHAIATFQALHDYLRPRVAGLLGGGSRLSGMLAALAASGFTGLPSSDGSHSAAPPVSGEASSSSAPAASSSGASVTRRRSQRLSEKNNQQEGDNAKPPSPPPTTATEASTDAPMPAETAPSDTVVEADFTDEEDVDAEVFDEDGDPDNSMADRTVTLAVAEDGSKVEAQTPEGTRVATPSAAARDAPSPSAHRSSFGRASYAAALKTKPTDWHIEFSMDNNTLPLDLTIYGAIHQHEMRQKSSALPSSMIWQGIYTIKFKKVPGPAPTPEARTDVGSRSQSPTLSSLPEDAPHAKILRLLRVLHQLNASEAERMTFGHDKRSLPESAFVNNKLTAKLTRQLEEPMIVASSCLPDWALDMPQHFAFLFPFATRYNFLQSTSFGYARLISKWQSQQSRGQENSSRRDDGIGFLGRLQRQKVRISRKHLLESAVKVFELYGSSSSILEVEYFDEVGTGLGPTLEFYSLVSREFSRKDLKIWRDSNHADTGPYVHQPRGLYPGPLTQEDIASDGGIRRTHILRVIGQFVAKAMLDSRIIDLHFNKIFLKVVLGEEVPLTIASLKLVDLDLANSLIKIQEIVATHRQTQDDPVLRKVAKVESIDIEDLALDFTIPGYDIELRPNGRNIAVTFENVDEYIHDILDAILGKGIQVQAKAFREGFSKVFPISDLAAFSADELVILFGNGDEDWSIETLSEAVKADHGFNPDSRAIRYLLEILSEFDLPTRRSYLQFITGSPKLPIGGFRGLNPPLTVVRKPHEPPLTADDYLPSVMTCVNYLKLPEYSTKEAMRVKLQTAMREGVGSFHLS